jgi:hypothetical protein
VSERLGVETKTPKRAVEGDRSSQTVALQRNTDDLVHEQLNSLPQMERAALQLLWVELFGKPPNPRLRRELLVMVLTYRVQEKAYGGLKPSTRKKLLAYAEGFTKDKEVVPKQVRATKPGTRIVREWGGKLHEVVVVDSGFTYDGQKYRSLSEIARQITGTRWSGPMFFGLKKRTKEIAA